MRRHHAYSLRWALLAAITVSLVGCRTIPMPTYSPLPASGDADLNWLAVQKGVNSAGWEIRQLTEDRLVVERNVKTHAVVLVVTRSDEGIETEYVDSTNLRCDPHGPSCSRIHKTYDRWVGELRAAIARSLDSPPTYEQWARDLAIDATSLGDIDFLRRLLSLEFNLDGAGYLSSDTSPLLTASTQNGTEMAKLLLDHGADPDLAISDGNTPLHLAAMFSRDRDRCTAAQSSS